MFKKTLPPSFREFTKIQLDNHVILSDCQLMDMYGKKYCRWDNYSMIAKKLESMRKTLWKMTKGKQPMLQVVKRVYHPIPATNNKINSQEIFYCMRIPLPVVEVKGDNILNKEI